MKDKKYLLYCQYCHYKRVFGDSDINSLSLQKSSEVQGGIPKYNEISKKTEVPPSKKGRYKGKCPTCGRKIFVQRYHEPGKNDQPD